MQCAFTADDGGCSSTHSLCIDRIELAAVSAAPLITQRASPVQRAQHPTQQSFHVWNYQNGPHMRDLPINDMRTGQHVQARASLVAEERW
jgi:hypothetical protein